MSYRYPDYTKWFGKHYPPLPNEILNIIVDINRLRTQTTGLKIWLNFTISDQINKITVFHHIRGENLRFMFFYRDNQYLGQTIFIFSTSFTEYDHHVYRYSNLDDFISREFERYIEERQ